MKHIAILLSISLLLPSSFGDNIVCEELPNDRCAFAIASSKRCILESYRSDNKQTDYQCRTSDVKVERYINYIESDQCVEACGVDRKSVGISSDELMEPSFVRMLCSPECFQMCPNVVDLYYNLAAGEGVHLPDLCHARRSNPDRAMAELMSSGSAAPGPVSSYDMSDDLLGFAPDGAPAPEVEYSAPAALPDYAPVPAQEVSDAFYNNAPAPGPGYSFY